MTRRRAWRAWMSFSYVVAVVVVAATIVMAAAA